MNVKYPMAIALVTVILGSILFSSANFSDVNAQTPISGVIDMDTTWTQAQSPYTLTGNLLVNKSVTLTIEPGVTVNLNNYYVRIDGVLKAEGTSTNKISIIRDAPNVISDESAIEFTDKSSPWNEKTKSGCIISNALVTSSLRGLSHTISISSASPKICNCTIFNTGFQRGIFIDNGTATVANNSISANFAGITVLSVGVGGNCTIAENVIYNCEVGIEVYGGSPIIEKNLIINCTGTETAGQGAIRIDHSGTNPTIRNNTILSNKIGLNFLQNATATILYNNFQNNTKYNIYLYPPQSTGNINATYNWWGTADADAAKQTMYDFKNDFNLGTVNLEPLLRSPNIKSPTYVYASAGDGGSISPDGYARINYGDDCILNMNPRSGYHVADVSINGTSIGAEDSYIIQNVQGATTVLATFSPNPTPTPSSSPSATPTPSPTPPTPTASPNPTPLPMYNITITHIGEGTVNQWGDDNLQVSAGAQMQLSATPAVNYAFMGWLQNGTLLSNSNPYNYLVTNSYVITAVFYDPTKETPTPTPDPVIPEHLSLLNVVILLLGTAAASTLLYTKNSRQK